MAKTVIAYNGTTFGSQGSSKGTVVFTPAQNPDHSSQKDTRT